VLTELKNTGATKDARKVMITFKDFNQFINLDHYLDLERRYA
jgi:hypothetical protein